ncbi:hypothetical protein Slin15195_G060460 [Septoria linicola]|uniref:NTF2-like domain-containing protein n=1 Tax=Septoria linicola TaxID=215465 RepID=A0A9Q9EK04_9PEZI|nr:hypothetical protein Slin14017_G076300 [Septoria linicola]USW52727.1 hypothetical protein Slin15195_G060460 [Septoria linicola]
MRNFSHSAVAAAALCICFDPTLVSARLYTSTRDRSSPPCLTEDETQFIASQFVQLFDTNSTGQVPTGAALPLSLLTPDYIDFDSDAVICDGPDTARCHVIGNDPPLLASRENLIKATEYAGKEVLKFVYGEYTAKVVHAFASCDEIAIRYEGSAKATADRKGVTVPGGTPVKWRGTSLLKVDLETRKVEMAESSEDRLTIYTQLGITSIDDVLRNE